jgi:threonine dehydratase
LIFSSLTIWNRIFTALQDIYHERAWLHSRVDQVMVKCVVETTGTEHSEKMLKYLEDRGYPLIRDSN